MAPRGYKLSEETKAKMSAARKGKPISEAHKQALRVPKSEETKAKMSAAHTGKTLSDETKARMSEAQKHRAAPSAETRAKISAARVAAAARKRERKPIYLLIATEIGTWVQWFKHSETEGQRETALTLFTSPKGRFELLMEDGTAEDYARLVQEHENLRPLPTVTLRSV